MASLKENKERRHQLLSNASALLQAGLDTPEKKDEYRKLIADADEIESTIVLQEKLERFMPPEQVSAPVAAAPAPVAAPALITSEESRARKVDRTNAGFRHYLRNGLQPDSAEQRDLITSSTGEAVIAQEFDGWVTALKNFGPIGALARRVKGTRPTKMTVVDDTAATMTYLPETGQTSTLEADPTLGLRNSVYRLSGVSHQSKQAGS